MSELTKNLHPESAAMALRMLEACGGSPDPQRAIDATVNLLGIHLFTHAVMKKMKRGELKAAARKAADNMVAMALANYDKAPDHAKKNTDQSR